MVYLLDPPLKPRRGANLNVLGVCRISTVHQDPKSLDDQEARLRRYVLEHSDTPVTFYFIKSQSSGEELGTAALLEAAACVESRQYDLIIGEDLGRFCRRNFAIQFCELCEDSDTRLIAINDNLDTARPEWRMSAVFSAFRHESYNKDTSERIRRSLRARFLRGEVVQTTIFGFVKPKVVTSDNDHHKPKVAINDNDLHKDPTAEPIYDEIFRRLEDGASFSEVADWMNQQNIPRGPYCRNGRWDGAMVARVVRNPIVKGVRVRNKKMARRVNKTGRRRSVDAPPEERLERFCPHLVFIEPERFDRVNALLDRRNAKFKRSAKDGIDPRKDVPKKKTRWPGQHVDCGICGRPYRYGGHGQTDHMMCSGAYEYTCWNGASMDGPLAAEKLLTAIMAEVGSLPDHDEVLTDKMTKEVERIRCQQAARNIQLQQQRQAVEHELANILDALRQAGSSNVLIAELKNLESQRDEIDGEVAALDRVPQQIMAVPPLGEIKARTLEALTSLARDSPELGRVMRQLISRIRVYPYRLCDGGTVVLRAKFTLDLVSLIPEARGFELGSQVLSRELTVDLFDPPQRAKHRERVESLRAEELTERQIAHQLEITQPAVQYAAALTRQMEERGLTDPYVPLLEPPDGTSKLTRHLHPRYQFKPLERGVVDPSIARLEPSGP
jgi:DNA invertase Pin-like site-specific DNA recombinase